MQRSTCHRFQRLTRVDSRQYTGLSPQQTSQLIAPLLPLSYGRSSLKAPASSLLFFMGILEAFSGPLKFEADIPF